VDGELVGAEADGAEPDAEDRPQALRPEVALPEGLQERASMLFGRTACQASAGDTARSSDL